MTKEEFNNAVKKLVEMRDVDLDSLECDKAFYQNFFVNLGKDHDFGKMIFMLFWTAINDVEKFQEKILEDWDLPVFQEFLGVADEYGWQWSEFISDAVYDFAVKINEN